jgi:hypothetical protein
MQHFIVASVKKKRKVNKEENVQKKETNCSAVRMQNTNALYEGRPIDFEIPTKNRKRLTVDRVVGKMMFPVRFYGASTQSASHTVPLAPSFNLSPRT